ncbi:MAG: mannitol-/sugar-/sorbitol-6-phosphatase [Pseudonocardiales bacterium]|nr:mannitol-/sugar-/sorbitol-6-phosphatase [Pseudonocardiales bacterium]
MTGARSAGGAVLLDMDGTLVLSEQVHRQTWWRFFEHWGVAVSEAEYERSYKGRRARDVLAQVDGPWTGTDTAAALRVLDEHTGEMLAAVQVVPGARELLRALHREARPVAVVTSAGRDWARQVLGDVLDAGDQVSVLVTADDIDLGKPSPEGYLRACELLRRAPVDCAGVEDSVSGIRALVAAGVGEIVGITTTSSPAELRAAGAHRTVPDLRRERWPGAGSPGQRGTEAVAPR